MKKKFHETNPAVIFQNAIQGFIACAISKGFLTEEQAIEVLESMHSEIVKAGIKE